MGGSLEGNLTPGATYKQSPSPKVQVCFQVRDMLAPVLSIPFIIEIQPTDICFTIKPAKAALDPTVRQQQTQNKHPSRSQNNFSSQVTQRFWQSLYRLCLLLSTMVFLLSINVNKIYFRYHSTIFRISSCFKTKKRNSIPAVMLEAL